MGKRIITLGTWEDKPIEWIVLNEESFGTLVISKYALFQCQFNQNQSNGNNWNKCFLRKFVNDEFYNLAFSESEKKKIVNAYLHEPSQTKDNVFVLSVAESDSLMTDKERATGDMQWTRSPNTKESIKAWRIGPDGGFDESGRYFSYSYVDKYFGIRPAMYVREE